MPPITLIVAATETVIALMFGLGLSSALSFSPVQVTVADMPFLDFLDQFGGTNVIIASGVIGAGLLCRAQPALRGSCVSCLAAGIRDELNRG